VTKEKTNLKAVSINKNTIWKIVTAIMNLVASETSALNNEIFNHAGICKGLLVATSTVRLIKYGRTGANTANSIERTILIIKYVLYGLTN
jgi:hypothetical protein